MDLIHLHLAIQDAQKAADTANAIMQQGVKMAYDDIRKDLNIISHHITADSLMFVHRSTGEESWNVQKGYLAVYQKVDGYEDPLNIFQARDLTFEAIDEVFIPVLLKNGLLSEENTVRVHAAMERIADNICVMNETKELQKLKYSIRYEGCCGKDVASIQVDIPRMVFPNYVEQV